MNRDKFFKIFSNILSDERDQIIVIIDGKPYTWNRAYDEIKNNTPLCDKILKKMASMGLL